MYLDDTIYYVWLSQKLGTGSAAFKKLYNYFGDAQKIYLCADYSQFNLTPKQHSSLLEKGLKNAEIAMNSALNNDFFILNYGDKSYPQKIKNISNPPPVLYCKGNLPLFDNYYSVGIVGTRKPTPKASQLTYELSSSLAKKGIMIISGLALGIDSSAHTAALDSNGFTVGISGVKAGSIYPKENAYLFNEVYNKGLVISEHSPTDNVEKSSFPMRNRIISALSDALIMIEAPEKSGALITAEKSLSMKKKVFVPRGDRISNSGGINLLNNGASALTDENDVLSYLSELNSGEFFNNNSPTYLMQSKFTKVLPQKANNNFAINTSSVNESKVKTTHNTSTFENVPEDISETEKSVYIFLLKNPYSSTDSIIKELSLTDVEAVTAVSMLEIYGYATRLPGDKWCII